MPVYSARGKQLSVGETMAFKPRKMAREVCVLCKKALLRSDSNATAELRDVSPWSCNCGTDVCSWSWSCVTGFDFGSWHWFLLLGLAPEANSYCRGWFWVLVLAAGVVSWGCFLLPKLVLGVLVLVAKVSSWIPIAGVGSGYCCWILTSGVAVAIVEAQSIGFTMPRGRPRMGSRRGGIQGRAPPQDDYYSPSSSVEVTSRPQWFQDSNDEEGGHRDSSPIAEERQRELPMLRYRLPCPQANSTLVVSITVEPGVNPSMEVEPLTEGQRMSREDSPIACLPVGAETGWSPPERNPGPGWMEPRRAQGMNLDRPAINLDLEAGPSARVDASLAGPSKPARKGSPDKVIHLSDSEDTLRFGCRIAEELQTSDED